MLRRGAFKRRFPAPISRETRATIPARGTLCPLRNLGAFGTDNWCRKSPPGSVPVLPAPCHSSQHARLGHRLGLGHFVRLSPSTRERVRHRKRSLSSHMATRRPTLSDPIGFGCRRFGQASRLHLLRDRLTPCAAHHRRDSLTGEWPRVLVRKAYPCLRLSHNRRAHPPAGQAPTRLGGLTAICTPVTLGL
jgi:hypothetical protein